MQHIGLFLTKLGDLNSGGLSTFTDLSTSNRSQPSPSRARAGACLGPAIASQIKETKGFYLNTATATKIILSTTLIHWKFHSIQCRNRIYILRF